jgi:hypothetical protein
MVSVMLCTFKEALGHFTCDQPAALIAVHTFLQPEEVCMVSVMPCTAKKHEAARPEVRNGGWDMLL